MTIKLSQYFFLLIALKSGNKFFVRSYIYIIINVLNFQNNEGGKKIENKNNIYFINDAIDYR